MTATTYQRWTRPLRTEPVAWFCNVVWGGNQYALQNFQMPGFEGYLLSVPCARSKAGGDIHYITVCDHGIFSKFLLLDVAGHGDSAAAISQRLQRPLTRLMRELDNRAILTELNENILREERAGSFATAAAATYNFWDRSWTYAYAGHPNMLIRGRGTWAELSERGASSLPVGILPGTQYFQNSMSLGEEDWILMFSDLLLEIVTPDGNRLGFPGLISLLDSIQEQEVGAFYQALADRLVEINGSDQFSDDLTIILLKHHTLPEQGGSGWRIRAVRAMRKGIMTLMKRRPMH